MMTFDIRKIVSVASILGMTYQTTALALTDYVATGTFYGDYLEVTQYDFDTGEDISIDAFIASPPFPLPTSTFTLGFTIDEAAGGSVPFFMNPTAVFDDALSNVSLSINGINIFSSTTEVTDVRQYFGDSQGFPSRWEWFFSPESDALSLPDVAAIDNETFETLGTISFQNFTFRLVDSTRQIYMGDGVSPLDMLAPSLSDFDGTTFEFYWFSSSNEEPEIGEEPPQINYTVFGTVDSLTNLSAVPLPGGIWLLLSALSGVVVVTRRNQQS